MAATSLQGKIYQHVEAQMHSDEPQPGSAGWHRKLIKENAEREKNKLTSRESMRQNVKSGSSSNLALSLSVPVAPRINSRDGVHTGTPNVRPLLSTMGDTVPLIARDNKVAQTARGKIQTARQTSPDKSPKQRPVTSEGSARMRQWQAQEFASRGNSREGLQTQWSDDKQAEMIRPMTQSERKQMTQKSLTSFQKFFNNSKTETIVPEPLGPSSLQSSSVEAYIDLEENELSDEELLQTLAKRACMPKTRVPHSEQFQTARRAQQLADNRLQSKSFGSDGKKHGKHGLPHDSEFKSTGLFVHTELERLRAMDRPRKNAMPEEARVAHCCSLLERLQVKYFDAELEELKEELFRAIFLDYGALKKMPAPRTREAFLEAKPYFEQLELEREKVQALEAKVKCCEDENEKHKDANHRLEARVKMLTEMRSAVVGKAGKGASGNGSSPGKGVVVKKVSDFEHEAMQSDLMSRGSVSRSLVSKFEHSGNRVIPDAGNEMSGANTWREGSRVGRGVSFRSIRQVSSSSLNASQPMPAEGGGLCSSSPGQGKRPNPFISAMPMVKVVASEINDLEIYLRKYHSEVSAEDAIKARAGHTLTSRQTQNDTGEQHGIGKIESTEPATQRSRNVLDNEEEDGILRGGLPGEGKEMKKVPPGHTLVMGQKLKRRKSTQEARWGDFAIYLSRHPEARAPQRDDLQAIYDKWRMKLDYKASFARMLRALERNKQIVVEGAAADKISYSSALGMDMPPSSDEEEDLEDVISERDARIVKLQVEKQSVEHKLAEEVATSAQKLERRMLELEEHSNKIFESAQRNHDERIKILQERIEELNGKLKAKEEELQKVRYLLQDGDSLAATAAKFKEEKEAAELKASYRERQLLQEKKEDHATIERLKKRIEVNDVILKTSREQLKIKVGFATQRALQQEQVDHQQQVQEIESLFHEQLHLAELRGNMRQINASMSERRLNVVMDIFQCLHARLEAVVVKADKDGKILMKANNEFAHARKRLAEQVDTEGQGSDTDAEHEEIGLVSSHGAQTDYTLEHFGLEPPVAKAGKSKGKGGKKKGREKKVVLDPLAPLDPEKQLEPSTGSSLGPPIVPTSTALSSVVKSSSAPAGNRKGGHSGQGHFKAAGDDKRSVADKRTVERCLWRHLIVKCGHKDVAFREFEDVKVNLKRIQGQDPRTSVFARLCNVFSPLPREMSQLLLILKANCWHPKKLVWAPNVRKEGLPSGSKGDTPEARDGVVGYNVALTHLRITCDGLEIRFDLALEWLTARLMVDAERSSCEVLSVGDVMAAATTQVDRKLEQLSAVYNAHIPAAPRPDTVIENTTGEGEDQQKGDRPILTINKLQEILEEGVGRGQLSYAHVVEVFIDLTCQCGGNAATGLDVAQVCLNHMSSLVAATPQTSQWHAKEDEHIDGDEHRVRESRGEQATFARDSTFLTTGS